MVSIVIVSHSARLAEGVRDLAQQMVQEKVQIAVAGGIDDPEQPIGTDAIKVLEAIRSVPLDGGVLVLMDLGSALLSAETALEFLEPSERSHVRLCPAPLVEGALAAAVQASVGGSLEAVCAEAMHALTAKQQQMPEFIGRQDTEIARVADQADGVELHLVVPNRLGLHARPAARFVATANKFQADMSVRKGDKEANAKSINQVATLGARQGDEITIIARGSDAEQALKAVQALADENFGDENGAAPSIEQEAPVETAPPAELAPGSDTLQGIGASPGIALGPLVHYRPSVPQIETNPTDDPDRDWQELQEAIAVAISDLEELQTRLTQHGAKAEAEIFAAHELILRDPPLLQAVEQRILDERLNAAAAWQSEIETQAEAYRKIDDAYMRARAGDVLDAGRRVLSHLLDLEPPSLIVEDPSIIAAKDLAPSDTARFDPQRILAICTELGGATSHSAILARALGIPAVVGIGPALQSLGDGETIAVDGSSGILWRQPSPEILADLRERQARFEERQAQARRNAQKAAITSDGRRLEIAANIGGPQDVKLALELGAEGVGLFRTEFLFMDRPQAPTEEEQFAAYHQVADALGKRPLIIRTLDVGGDKPLPYLDMEPEENPFLGWRGIRFCLDNPQIFLPQLRAILRASLGHNIKLMFPMVSSLPELRGAKEVLDQARDDLRRRGKPFAADVEVGIMVEVPAAVTIADQLAREVDFFSIGTNDLTQYAMAADRGNRRVSDLADALQPAVLGLVAQTVEAGHAAGIWVGMCGELAGRALATPLLIGLGLDELSMNAPAIPRVKERVRATSAAAAEEIVADILRQSDAPAVKEYLQSSFPDSVS